MLEENFEGVGDPELVAVTDNLNSSGCSSLSSHKWLNLKDDCAIDNVFDDCDEEKTGEVLISKLRKMMADLFPNKSDLPMLSHVDDQDTYIDRETFIEGFKAWKEETWNIINNNNAEDARNKLNVSSSVSDQSSVACMQNGLAELDCSTYECTEQEKSLLLDENKEKDKELEALKLEQQYLKEYNRSLRQTHTDLEEQIRAIEVQISSTPDVTQELYESKERTKELELECEDIKKQNKIKLNTLNSRNKELVKEIAEVKEEIDCLATSYQECQSKLSNAERIEDSLRDRLEDLENSKQEINRLLELKSKLSLNNKRLKEEKALFQQSIAQYECTIKNMQNRLQSHLKNGNSVILPSCGRDTEDADLSFSPDNFVQDEVEVLDVKPRSEERSCGLLKKMSYAVCWLIVVVVFCVAALQFERTFNFLECSLGFDFRTPYRKWLMSSGELRWDHPPAL